MTAVHQHPHTAEHEHHHEHEHGHGSHTESYAHVRGGPTVLDIGGDIGAMIATMNRSAAGSELHLRSEHQPPIEIHTGVWIRGAGDDEVTTAVFAELVQGTYWVLDDDGAGVRQVEVNGGELSSIDLRH